MLFFILCSFTYVLYPVFTRRILFILLAYCPGITTTPAFVGTVGAVAKQSTDARRVARSIPARNRYVDGLHAVISGLAVYVYEFKCLFTHPWYRNYFPSAGVIFFLI